MTTTTETIAQITAAPTLTEALNITGRAAEDTHQLRTAYIVSVFGPRAVSGFFRPTRANVNIKFADAWRTATACR